MGLLEHDLPKHQNIDFLKLSSVEWRHVGQFADLLSVCYSLLYEILSILTIITQYADVAQQAFSSEQGSTLHLVSLLIWHI
jgi:hypothetical protein